MVVESPPILEQITVADLKRMPLPRAVLMCPPDWFDVVGVKNPFMRGQVGNVDRRLAKQQWDDLKKAFGTAGVEVQTLPPVGGCEDMVFCANPIFSGLDGAGERVCVLSHMHYASRKAEVSAHAVWCRANGYRVVSLDEPVLFEGGGDAIWHPGRRLIWGGYGRRSSAEIYGEIAQIFDAPVIMLELSTELFHQLDTCFCPIDEKTVLLHPPALTNAGIEAARSMFECVIEVDEIEAVQEMACNAAPFFGKYVVIQRGATMTSRRLRERGFEVIEVDTSEFIKSGGSVYSLKMYLF